VDLKTKLGKGKIVRINKNVPLGTKVNIRYDLEIVNEEGDTIQLPDIYDWKDRMLDNKLVASLVMSSSVNHFCYCSFE
jgi:hypothetical protein